MPVRTRSFSAALVVAGLALTACSGGGAHPAAAVSTPSTAATTPPATTTSTTLAATTCPLTGEAPRGSQDINRVALAVKIDNIIAARPQSGVNHADVVVEELVEGGLTRLFAIFQCDSATRLGPIRSARTSDADMLALLHGSVFGFSGSNPRALPAIRANGNTVMIPFDSLPQYYHRDYSRPAPHNVYSTTQTILAAGLSRRHGLTAPKPLFTYGDISPLAHPATSVGMTWPAATAGWTWSGTAWSRTQNGTPDVLTDGTRVSAANVIVMSIDIGSTGIRDVAGNASPLDITVGTNRVWVFRNGHVISGTWHRAGVSRPLLLLDSRGHVIALAPGKTWVELLPKPRLPKIA
jgi:hypothetical protein